MAFDYHDHYCDSDALIDDYRFVDRGSPDELVAVRALRDHLNTYPGIDDDKPADDLWKLRADYIDGLAGHDVVNAWADIAIAACALVAALDAAGDQVTP